MAQPEMSQKGQTYQNYGAVYTETPLPAYYVTPAPPSRTSFTSSRFFKAGIVALALLELSYLSRHLFIHKHPHIHPHPYPHWDDSISGLNHDADDCSVWDHYDPDHHSTSAYNGTTSASKRFDAGDKYSFTIPTSSSRYHFASWGPIDKSSFEVIPVESDKDQIVVEVEVTKDPEGIARVCSLPSKSENDGERYGVGFYAPRLRDRDNYYFPAFNVLVYVPTKSSQQHLNSFETRLGQFEHIFPDLSSSINFSHLHVSAANVPMTFESVTATDVRVSGANAPIRGKLTSATDLIVSNANREIKGEYTLTQAGKIHISNANAPIEADIHLKAGDFHPRPDYYVQASNANAPISIKVVEQPTGSGLFFKASSVMSAVRVHLHAAFEGSFKLTNILKQPYVEVINKDDDPAGRGRERFVQFDRRGSTTSGRVGWGSPDDAKEHAPGDVKLDTIGAPLELFFD
ncbi:hypothetical protein RhiJN_14897 [Ceratobasidium sp. AG-Ba]|nr:hypothetical protein RhiJN_14897 [Ceratobasidium sp. AG-Ba]